MMRRLLNMSELGLTYFCLLTSSLAVSESYLSISDAQLLCLLALGVMEVVSFVSCFGRVIYM